MSPEKQRITIAEACGWINIGPIGWMDKDGNDWNILPDYLTDLNAMHEAEKLLEDIDQEGEYLCQLETIVTGRKCWKISEANIAALWMATAAQRAEAFLKTLDKWEK